MCDVFQLCKLTHFHLTAQHGYDVLTRKNTLNKFLFSFLNVIMGQWAISLPEVCTEFARGVNVCFVAQERNDLLLFASKLAISFTIHNCSLLTTVLDPYKKMQHKHL